MPDLLIRNVPARAVAALKRRAKRHGRSLQREALAIVESAARATGDDLADELERMRASGVLALDAEAALAALREDRTR
jgi:plasmid stability protein